MHWTIPNVVGIVRREGCKEIYSFSKHWRCLFPQRGEGPKFKRPIVLEPWQQWIAVERMPHMLLRGLIHSGGRRVTNLFAMACDRSGIEWRRSYKWTTSVSRRNSVEAMDGFIGPKS